jgi:hypothetical protein
MLLGRFRLLPELYPERGVLYKDPHVGQYEPGDEDRRTLEMGRDRLKLAQPASRVNHHGVLPILSLHFHQGR